MTLSAALQNEVVLEHASSSLNARLDGEIARQIQHPQQLPLIIGGERITPERAQEFSVPHRHSLKLGQCTLAEPADRGGNGCSR